MKNQNTSTDYSVLSLQLSWSNNTFYYMADTGTTYSLVLITASSSGEAQMLAATLVKERLAACVNISGPVTSVYTWEGRLEKSSEFLLLCKTRTDLFEQVAARVHSLHSYQVPEIIRLPITGGSAAYMEWMNTVLLSATDD